LGETWYRLHIPATVANLRATPPGTAVRYCLGPCHRRTGTDMRLDLKIALALALLLQLPAARAQHSLVLASAVDFESKVSQAVLKEAYKQLGIQLTINELPAERALIESNAGHLDGEVNRMEGIDKSYPNLLRVAVPLAIIEGVVFSKTVKFAVKGWESLRPYSIGTRIGLKFAEYGTAGMKVTKAVTIGRSLADLDAGQVDIVVASRQSGLAALAEMKLKGITVLEPPLAAIPLYHYLHKSHLALLPKITEALQKMEKSGQMETIRSLETARLMAAME